MRFFSWLLVFTLWFGSGAVAQEVPNDSDLAAQGWRVLSFENKKNNIYQQDEQDVIRVQTNSSVSVLYKDVQVNLAETPQLSWSWRVDEMVPATDLSVKGKDDRALAVYVSFPFDRERATFWEGFIRSFVEIVKGKDAPGRVLNYVWGGDVSPGTVLESPYLKSAGGMIILKSAKDDTGVWFNERVNIAKDYERIFGVPANRPYQIAISADTDDTQIDSLAFIKGLKFTP